MAAKVLAIVLAGGEGKRLMPLTADRAKPAVPFGGVYRLVDFVLSNLVNGDITRICAPFFSHCRPPPDGAVSRCSCTAVPVLP